MAGIVLVSFSGMGHLAFMRLLAHGSWTSTLSDYWRFCFAIVANRRVPYEYDFRSGDVQLTHCMSLNRVSAVIVPFGASDSERLWYKAGRRFGGPAIESHGQIARPVSSGALGWDYIFCAGGW